MDEENNDILVNQSTKEKLPVNIRVMETLLNSMGVGKHDPKVTVQLLDFIYRYSTEVLQDAQIFAEHANSKTIRIEDLQLAVESKSLHQFTFPPDRETIEDIAHSVNSIPLVPISEKHGLRLPPERYALTGANFQIIPDKITLEKTRDELNQNNWKNVGSSLKKKEQAPKPVAVVPGTNIVAPPSAIQKSKNSNMAAIPIGINNNIKDEEDYDMS